MHRTVQFAHSRRPNGERIGCISETRHFPDPEGQLDGMARCAAIQLLHDTTRASCHLHSVRRTLLEYLLIIQDAGAATSTGTADHLTRHIVATRMHTIPRSLLAKQIATTTSEYIQGVSKLIPYVKI